MVDEKVQEIESTGVDAVVSGDVSCLMQLEGRLAATGSDVKPLHIAQILAKQERAT
jgi:L-lactate dehydrogenase complex protein LldE